MTECTWRDVLDGKAQWAAQQGDCIELHNSMPEQSVDLLLGSPPYLDARTYGIDAQRNCAEWVEWMLAVSEAACRVSKGLVLWVVSGVTRDNNYWPGCEGLAWEWWKRGNHQWRPCVWWKVDDNDGGTGIPGSGGKQWLRADWEYVLAFKRPGWLPWADNTAMGWEPKYDRTGGAMSNRTPDGQRINAKVGSRLERGVKDMYTRNADGTRDTTRGEVYTIPEEVNPGNVLRIEDGLVVKARVGGGHIGSKIAHKNEAPFPEKLVEFFVRSFCPEGGIVCDPFVGSGTTLAVARRWGRRGIGFDLRASQIELTCRRVAEEVTLFDGADQ